MTGGITCVILAAMMRNAPSRRDLAALALAMLALPARAGQLQVVSRLATVQDFTQALLVRAPQLERDFVVQVTSSPNIPAGGKVPVLYALDGGLGVTGPLGGFLAVSGGTAPMIVVTIGYQPKDYRFRNSDLLHKPVERKGVKVGGGGAALEAFLRDDLRPYIEASYPVDPARSYFFGHSYGAAFALNVLVHQPHAFAGYLIASPSLPPDPDLATALGGLTGEGRRICLSRGEHDLPGIAEDYDRLRQVLGRGGFVVTDRVYAGANHASYLAAMLLDALPLMLPPK